MRLVLRTDLGGRIAELPALTQLGGRKLTKPFTLLQGSNGSGKSTLLAALRTATGLVGTGLGAFTLHRDRNNMDPLPLRPNRYSRAPEHPDLARYQLMVYKSHVLDSSKDTSAVPVDAAGVLDPEALGWRGQRVWLHSGREAEAEDGTHSMDIAAMRRHEEDGMRSYGEMATGQLRYAIAWALGEFELRDAYDKPDPDETRSHNSYSMDRYTPRRDVFRILSGHAVGQPEQRHPERWLLLDEPETGLDPLLFARLMLMLASQAKIGRLRVLCATHSPLAEELALLPNVERIDLDGFAPRLAEARALLRSPKARLQAAREEHELLQTDCARGIATERGLRQQGRFTAHQARSVPYASAELAPYGREELRREVRDPEPDPDADDAAPSQGPR